jgi:hypothetical protein
MDPIFDHTTTCPQVHAIDISHSSSAFVDRRCPLAIWSLELCCWSTLWPYHFPCKPRQSGLAFESFVPRRAACKLAIVDDRRIDNKKLKKAC